MTLSLRTSYPNTLHTGDCLGGGLLEAADLGREGGEAITTTMIREEMTTSTTSDSVRPTHININLSDKEKGGLLDKEKGGERLLWMQIFMGEKIWTAMTEKEKKRVRARVTRRTAVAGGGVGVKTTTTEVAVEATAVTGGVDTGATTTVTTTTMVTAMPINQLSVCDASTEEKECPSNLSWMHTTIK
jgi:hypothetical protein